jgi:4-diphosphocytidyl-2-C-methyl-D-erythritol kinase
VSGVVSAGALQPYAAPAKINLFLHVVGRRPDGYHLLQSAMQLIDLADTVSIAARDDGVIARAAALPGIPEADDLTIRAARLLQSASGTRHGATIAVEKRIPIGGGLGGGSSDAATVLLALNRLWNLDWPRRRLMDLGLTLGADVPFFIGGRNAFAEGIGEALTPIDLPPVSYALIHPGVSVPTAAIFTASELTRDTAALKISDFSKNGFGAALESGDPVLKNDLEPVAAARFSAVREALDWLSRDFGGESREARGRARMSGSGACVFRAFDTPAGADACIARLPEQWAGWSVRSLVEHPLRAYAAD